MRRIGRKWCSIWRTSGVQTIIKSLSQIRKTLFLTFNTFWRPKNSSEEQTNKTQTITTTTESSVTYLSPTTACLATNSPIKVTTISSVKSNNNLSKISSHSSVTSVHSMRTRNKTSISPNNYMNTESVGNWAEQSVGHGFDRFGTVFECNLWDLSARYFCPHYRWSDSDWCDSNGCSDHYFQWRYQCKHRFIRMFNDYSDDCHHNHNIDDNRSYFASKKKDIFVGEEEK